MVECFGALEIILHIIVQKRIGEDTCYVIVYTNDGLEHKGLIHYSGKGNAPKDIIIHKPKLIIRDSDWTIKEEIEFGNELLFSEKDILRIVFLKDL